MNILICDDDKLYVDMIRKYVDEFFADHKITDYKVYEYNSGDEVAKNNEKIDIAFLDVEMDGINGIEAGKCLRNNNKNIVLFIITSYMGYLDDAMDEGVFRYINKPLERPVIMRGLHKALLLCSKSQSKKINIEYKGDNVIIEQDSIICIESLVRKRYIKGHRRTNRFIKRKKNCIQAENASVSGRAGVGGYGNYNQLCICTYYRSYNIVDEYAADV